MNPEKPLIEKWREESRNVVNEGFVNEMKRDLEKLFDEEEKNAIDNHYIDDEATLVNLRSKILGSEKGEVGISGNCYSPESNSVPRRSGSPSEKLKGDKK